MGPLLVEPLSSAAGGVSGLKCTFNRPERQNALDGATITGLHDALTAAEADPEARMFVLAGLPGVFCTGLDFEDVVKNPPAATAPDDSPSGLGRSPYLDLLSRFSKSRLSVVALVDGKVLAGGVGLVAAADVALATPRASFALSEALWGLLPAMVMPFLVRRVGFQRAYEMTMTTRTVNAEEALRCSLVDGVAEDLPALFSERTRRLGRLDPATMIELKRYFRRMWILDDEMEAAAGQTFDRLIRDPRVQDNIRNYVTYGRLPWERW